MGAIQESKLSKHANVLSLGTLTVFAGFGLKFYLVALIEGTEALAFNRGEVYKHIRTTILSDKTKAFFCVEPLY